MLGTVVADVIIAISVVTVVVAVLLLLLLAAVSLLLWLAAAAPCCPRYFIAVAIPTTGNAFIVGYSWPFLYRNNVRFRGKSKSCIIIRSTRVEEASHMPILPSYNTVDHYRANIY